MKNNYHLLFHVEKIKKVLNNSATIMILASFDQC